MSVVEDAEADAVAVGNADHLGRQLGLAEAASGNKVAVCGSMSKDVLRRNQSGCPTWRHIFEHQRIVLLGQAPLDGGSCRRGHLDGD